MTDLEKQLTKENDLLRGMVSKLKIPCHYCGLDDMSKCKSGFPGCALADDMMIGEDETFKRVAEERNELIRLADSLVDALNIEGADQPDGLLLTSIGAIDSYKDFKNKIKHD